MPSLGADMERGVVVEWFVGPGDQVKRGDAVMLVDTDKGLIEVEIWQGGTIESIVIPTGREVDVGTVLATLTDTEPQKPDAHRRITPQAKTIAAELGVDVEGIVDREPITEQTVRASVPADGMESPHRQCSRDSIARAMSRSNRDIPHYYLGTEIDVTDAVAWMTSRNESGSVSERINSCSDASQGNGASGQRRARDERILPQRTL